MKNFICLLITFCAVSFISCGDDDKATDCELVGFTQRADANLAIGTTWTADPNMANCQAYEADLQSLISDYQDCDSAIIQGQVGAFQQALDNLDCM